MVVGGVARCSCNYGVCTVLGVSNISFGLPRRDIINSTFFVMAMEKGLDCAIMNPFSEGMMNAYYAYNALHNLDTACTEYIGYADSDALKPKQTIGWLWRESLHL